MKEYSVFNSNIFNSSGFNSLINIYKCQQVIENYSTSSMLINFFSDHKIILSSYKKGNLLKF
jgi:hypothetical protein